MNNNLFHKTMQGNFSQSPHDHEDALNVLAEKNYDIIPEIYHFDNEKYCCQMINDSISLKQYMEETADFDIANKVIENVTLFFLDVSKNTKDGLHLIPDDIHDENLILDKDKNIYLVDLDMFGWWPKNLVFQKLGVAISNVSHSINYAMLYHERQQMINDHTKQIEELSNKLHEQNQALFEAGVRHGFWNVDTVEEIKQKYEVYKPTAM